MDINDSLNEIKNLGKKFTHAEEAEEMRKMYAGEPHKIWAPSLFKANQRARMLCWKYNRTSPNQFKLRMKLITKIFGRTGEWIMVDAPFHCMYGKHIEVGNYFYANVGCVILDGNRVTIGKNVMLGPNVQIYATKHPVKWKERLTAQHIALPIKIGDNCWICGGAIILPGVTIGANTTIGAGSVVTKSIPANVLACGNPCRVIKRLI